MAKKQAKRNNGNGANLGFEQTLWLAADKLRNNLDAAEYKHVVLGLIFLKYISDAFAEVYAKLTAQKGEGADAEDPDEYRAQNVFWVPQVARWAFLQNNAKQPKIGKLVDEAMDAIERDNPSLKGVLPKQYARPALDKQRLGELIDLIGTIGLGDKENRSKDILGRVYEYFLKLFAAAEGKNGGQFYTAKCVVRLLVEILSPYKGRVFDPCCGSGGMFVQSEKFVEEHGGRIGDISIYGQESNPTTRRLTDVSKDTHGKARPVKSAYIAGVIPDNDSFWEIAKSQGFTVRRGYLGSGNRSKQDDAYLITDLTATLFEEEGPSTIVLVAGDADYVPPLIKAIDRGWRNEVAFINRGASASLELVAHEFRVISPSSFQHTRPGYQGRNPVYE